VAVHTVVVAFRTGLHSADVGARIEKSISKSEWSVLVPGLSAETVSGILDEFSKAHVRITQHIFLSEANT